MFPMFIIYKYSFDINKIISMEKNSENDTGSRMNY